MKPRRRPKPSELFFVAWTIVLGGLAGLTVDSWLQGDLAETGGLAAITVAAAIAGAAIFQLIRLKE